MIFEKKLNTFMDFCKIYESGSDDNKIRIGCAMLYFDFNELKDIQDKISDDDIYDDDGDHGLETEPHVTLLYGLHSDEVTHDEIFEIIKEYDIPNLKLFNISIFENEKYDVLKFEARHDMEDYDINGDILYKINKELSKLPHSSNFPEYNPHSTIAYVNPGTGKKYVDLFKDSEYIVSVKKIVYSEDNKDFSKRDKYEFNVNK